MDGTEERLDRVESDIKELRTDVAGIREDLAGVRESLSHMATKEDLAEVRGAFSRDLAEVSGTFSRDLAEVSGTFSRDLAEIKGSLKDVATKEDVAIARHDVTKAKLAMVTSMLAAAVAVGAIASRFLL